MFYRITSRLSGANLRVSTGHHVIDRKTSISI